MSLRDKAGRLVMAPRVQNFIMALIIFNALTLGLETSSSIRNSHGQVLSIIDQLVLSVFVLEILNRAMHFLRRSNFCVLNPNLNCRFHDGVGCGVAFHGNLLNLLRERVIGEDK